MAATSPADHHAAQRHAIEVGLLHRFVGDVHLLGPRRDHARHARPFDNARKDRVHADVGGSELLGEAMGEADNAPFGGRVRGAERVSEPSGRRRQIDDRAAAGALEHRHGMVRAEELPGQADVDRSTPVLGPDVFDSAGRSGDAGVVDENVEAAERALDLGETGATRPLPTRRRRSLRPTRDARCETRRETRRTRRRYARARPGR